MLLYLNTISGKDFLKSMVTFQVVVPCTPSQCQKTSFLRGSNLKNLECTLEALSSKPHNKSCSFSVFYLLQNGIELAKLLSLLFLIKPLLALQLWFSLQVQLTQQLPICKVQQKCSHYVPQIFRYLIRNEWERASRELSLGMFSWGMFSLSF